MKLSIVIPIYNEESNIEKLHLEVLEATDSLNLNYEVIYINDGSTDSSLEKLKNLIVRATYEGNLTFPTSQAGDSKVKVVNLRKNFGQTAALNEGFKQAQGEVIITMDGDLQNDPHDIPKLLAEIEKGYDCVSGWRTQRKDTFSKKIFSRGAYLLRKIILKDTIHDAGCSLKAYQKTALQELSLFGETHRFIPAILAWQGYLVKEVPVNHRPREFGKTKYNYKRMIKGLLDMCVVWFWYKFSDRPLYLFGGAGAALIALGSIIGMWMFTEKVFFGAHLQNRIWPLVSVFSLLAGIQLFGLGILADIGLKTYFSKNGRKTVKEIIA